MAPKTITGVELELDDGPARGAELFLVDGNNLAYRAFFALPEELATSDGMPTNALLGFGNMLFKLLADYQPDILKLDMALIRNIDTDRARQTLVGAMAAVGTLLGIAVIAEGVEQPREALVLHKLGISLMQGYLFARPGFEMLPQVDFGVLTPKLEPRAGAA